MKNEVEIQELLQKMTISEKIGQLTQVFSDILLKAKSNHNEREQVGLGENKIYEIGSISGLAGASNVRLAQEQYLANSRLKIPLLFMMDVIHGYQLNYQIASGLGSAFDDKLVYDLSRLQACEAAANGTTISYTPMSDQTYDPRWGRIMEIPSEDLFLNQNYLKIMIKAMQGNLNLEEGNIGTCVKHIAGYGLAEGGRDYGTVDASLYQLQNFIYPLYRAGINAGSVMAMTAFNTLDGIPCTANQDLLERVVRKEWGFAGVLISDHSSINELKIHGYTDSDSASAKASLDAGVDIELGTLLYRNNLENLLKTNQIEISKIDEAVLRVLRLKNKLGLFDNPFKGIDEELAKKIATNEENISLIRRAGNETMILLKNENDILPLDENQAFVYAGPHSDTNQLIGFNACAADLHQTKTIKQSFKQTLGKHINGIHYEENLDEGVNQLLAYNDGPIILTIGEHTRYSGEGVSRSEVTLPQCQIELIKTLKKANKKIIAIIFAGRPLALSEIIDDVEAIIFAWFPGTETGNSVADILFGKANPCAKTPFSFVKSRGQIPLHYNHLATGRPKNFVDEEYVTGYRDIDNEPLFEFGFGLSYTEFSYGKINLSHEKFTEDEKVKIEVEVTNTGKRAGKEIVQLYIQDIQARRCRPVKELKGYLKKEIQPGETINFAFELTLEDFKYYDTNGEMIYDYGKFNIFVGKSSKAVQQKTIELIEEKNA